MDCQTQIGSDILTNKSLGIDKCPYEILRTEWMDNFLVAVQDGVDITIKSY